METINSIIRWKIEKTHDDSDNVYVKVSISDNDLSRKAAFIKIGKSDYQEREKAEPFAFNEQEIWEFYKVLNPDRFIVFVHIPAPDPRDYTFEETECFEDHTQEEPVPLITLLFSGGA